MVTYIRAADFQQRSKDHVVERGLSVPQMVLEQLDVRQTSFSLQLAPCAKINRDGSGDKAWNYSFQENAQGVYEESLRPWARRTLLRCHVSSTLH